MCIPFDFKRATLGFDVRILLKISFDSRIKEVSTTDAFKVLFAMEPVRISFVKTYAHM